MMIRLLLTHSASAILAIWLTLTCALAKTVEVATPVDLQVALADSARPLTIALAPGDYGKLVLNGTEGITLRSADPKNPAILREITLRGARDVTLQDLDLSAIFPKGTPEHAHPFTVTDSQQITFKNLRIRGQLALGGKDWQRGFPTGTGLIIRNSSGVNLHSLTLSHFKTGILFMASTDIRLENSLLTQLRSDGINLAEVSDMVISDNVFKDFLRSPASPDHADMIQAWTTKTTAPTRNLVIRNNLLDAGKGEWTQSIFLRNELADQGKAGREIWYQDIVISGNEIRNAHRHGITVGESIHLIIKDNLVLFSPETHQASTDRDLIVPMISVNPVALDVTISGNTVARIDGFMRQTDWSVTNNHRPQEDF